MNPLKQINMFIDSIFETEINFNNSLLIDTIDHINANESRVISNEGGWQSYLYDLKTHQAIDDLFNNKIIYYTDTLLDKYKIDVSNKQIKCRYWINVNYKYSYNRLHDHAGSILSGIYYIKVPSNSGKLVFHKDSSNTLIDIAEYNEYNSKIYEYEPKENKLLLFSPYLKHEVLQNKTDDADDKRISIAFNLMLD